jgi:plastocyanin
VNRITWILVTLLAAGALAVAGCGDDDDDGGAEATPTEEATETPTETPTPAETPEAEEGDDDGGGGGGETLTLTADPGGAISWEPGELSAAAGEVSIELVNESSTPHAVEVEGNGVEEESDTITGSTTTLSVDLEPGEYVYYCPVGNHRAGGMEGQLLIE